MKRIFLFTVFTTFISTFQTLSAQMKNIHITPEETTICYKINKSASTALRKQLHLSEEHTFQNIRTETDSFGYSHERFEQYYQGIKVEEADVRVHYKDGKFYYANGEYIDCQGVDTSTIISKEKSILIAKKFVCSRIKTPASDTLGTRFIDPPLVICHNKMNTKDRMPHVCYKIDIYSFEKMFWEYIYVDVKDGEVINHVSIIHFDNGTAATRYSGTRTISTKHNGSQYVLRDSTRGNGIKTYNFNNKLWYLTLNYSSATDFIDNDNNWTKEEHHEKKDDAALDAHWGAMKTYDYFFEKHGRKSFNDSNAAIKNYVHVRDTIDKDWDNAAWLEELNVIVYGDGELCDILTSLDIVAHEFGHAVCQYSANLVYQGESGAINESLSDIWAACVEKWVDSTKRTWLIGEEIDNIPFRSMNNPNLLGQPDTYADSNYWGNTNDISAENDYGGVHTNSGVMNYWFYLLSDGGSDTNDHGYSYNVQGIGIDSAAKIVYRAETVYMTRNTNFFEARESTIRAAVDLFSENSVKVQMVKEAWNAVGVYSDLYVRDSVSDIGNEPSNVKYMWNSPDIWLEDLHKTPIDNVRGGDTCYVCVRIHNRSNKVSRGAERLYINWIKAGITTFWPDDWTGKKIFVNYEGDTIQIGDYVYNNPNDKDILYHDIPTIPAHGFDTVKVKWVVPIPDLFIGSEYANELEHFCLLARVHDGNPIPNENDYGVNMGVFTTNSNNVAWKNITILARNRKKAYVTLYGVGKPICINYIPTPNEYSENLRDFSEVKWKMDAQMYNIWVTGGMQGSGFSLLSDSSILITTDNVSLCNLNLNSNQIYYIGTEVLFHNKHIPQNNTFDFNITSSIINDNGISELVGGEHYTAIRSGDCEYTVHITGDTDLIQGESATFTATGAESYRWYNGGGEQLSAGESMTAVPAYSQCYYLETTGGLCGYISRDTICVHVSEGEIVTLYPNPTNDNVHVEYQITGNYINATIQIANELGIIQQTVTLNEPQGSVTLDVQGLHSGAYYVLLKSPTGKVLDMKTLVKGE